VLDALESLLAGDPHFTVVQRTSDLAAILAPGAASVADVALVMVNDSRPLRTLLAARDDHAPALPLVVLCEGESLAPARALVRLGVRAILPNNASGQEISAALDAVSAGLVAFTPETLEALVPGPSRLPVALAPPAGTGLPLSPRELEILALVAEGLGNKIVASRLGISEHTVKTHIASIFTKLGAETRAEAVAIGARRGLLLL
jgi:DNA-binding NarL/FixJ family response regulator